MFYYFLIGIPLFIFLAFVFVPFFEKQYLAGDLEEATEDAACGDDPYFLESKKKAAALGFRHCGDFTTKKEASMVKGVNSFWLMKDGKTSVEIISAKIAGVFMRKCNLRSVCNDDTVFLTSDDSPLVDLSGKTNTEVLINGSISELIKVHTERIQVEQQSLLVIDGQNILAWYEALHIAKGKRLVNIGFANWADNKQHKIRYTIKGCIQNFYSSFIKQTASLASQSERMNLPRAGQQGVCESTYFRSFDGKELFDPDFLTIEEFITAAESQFWQEGSGDVLLRFSDDDLKTELILMLHERHGFYVQFSDYKDDVEYVLFNGENDPQQKLTLTQAGEPIKLPAPYFNSVENVLLVVQDFMGCGGMLSDFEWRVL